MKTKTKIELILTPQEKDDLENAIWLETRECLEMLKKEEGEKEEKKETNRMIKSLDRVMAQLLQQ